MKNNSKFKLVLVALLTLSFFACDGLDQFGDFAIDIPIEETKTIEVIVTQEMYDSMVTAQNRERVLVQIASSFKASEEEIEEYGDRVQELDVTELRVKGVNVTEIPSNGVIEWIYGQYEPGSLSETVLQNPIVLDDLVATEQTLDITGEDIEKLQDAILNKEKIDYYVRAIIDGPAIFDLDLTIVGTLKVTAAQ